MAHSLQRIVRGLPARQCITPLAMRPMIGNRHDIMRTRTVGIRHFATELKVTDLGGESITDGAISEWNVKVGDFVRKGQVVCVIETDKVSVDVTAECDGVLKEIHAQEDDTVEVGDKLASIEPGEVPAGAAPVPAAAPDAGTPAEAAPPAAAAQGPPLKGLRLTFARLRAKRLGLPDPLSSGTTAAADTSAEPAAVGVPAASGVEGRLEHRVPISRIRNHVMADMKRAKETAALLSTFQEMDMSAVQALESKYQDLFQKMHDGHSFSSLSFIVKASAMALMEEPGVNAVIDDKEAVYREFVDIAVPIHTPRGIVSCVLRDVQSMSVVDIEKGIAKLTAKAARDELDIEDVSPCTFAIRDDHGMLGTGLISEPTSATMGLNAITVRPVAVGKKVEARPVMFTSLTYDHRQIDGREAVTFLASVRNKIEDPARMLMGL